MLYEEKLKDFIKSDRESDKNEVPNSVFLQLWLRKVLTDIKEETDKPLSRVVSRAVELGTAIFEYKYGEEIKELKIIWKKLRWSKNTWISSLSDYKFSINNLSEIKRRFIKMPKWCNGKLGDLSQDLNIDKSSVVRLVMYYALETYDDLNDDAKKEIENETKMFNKQIRDMILVLGELEKLEKENE